MRGRTESRADLWGIENVLVDKDMDKRIWNNTMSVSSSVQSYHVQLGGWCTAQWNSNWRVAICIASIMPLYTYRNSFPKVEATCHVLTKSGIFDHLPKGKIRLSQEMRHVFLSLRSARPSNSWKSLDYPFGLSFPGPGDFSFSSPTLEPSSVVT